jgi:hypothetical protein
MAWTFFEYVGASGRGVVRDWIGRMPNGTRQRVEAQLDALVGELELLDCDAFDRPHGVGQLRHDCAGFFELILKVDRVQYRPIGYYGPARREFTLLGMSAERGNVLVDDHDCSKVRGRHATIINRSHIREYL